MSTVVLRSVKGSPLTYAEMDANFNNLNTDKLEAGTAATNIANTPAGNIAAVTVQAAINELDTEKAAVTQLPSGSNLLPVGSGGTASASASAARTALGTVGVAGDNLTGGLNGKLTTIASATTPDIFATTVGNLIDYTGTTTCTGFTAAPQAGAERTLVCAAAAVFTAGANMLIDGLASGQSYTATAGDKVIVRAVTTTQFRLTMQPYTGVSRVVQVVTASYSTASSSASTIPFDSTIPQSGEGLQILSVAITPTNTNNRLRIDVSIPMIDSSALGLGIAALFQDATTNALATVNTFFSAADYTTSLYFTHEMAAGTTSSTTFKVNIGVNSGTVYVNRRQDGGTLGGATAAKIIVTEIRV